MEEFPCDEDQARELLERLRWPNGPVCVHCGAANFYRLTARTGTRTHVRNGVLKCSKCRKQYSVTVDTVLENSHISLKKWLLAINLLCVSKKGLSIHYLQRRLRISYQGAWFLVNRLRLAVMNSPLAGKLLKGQGRASAPVDSMEDRLPVGEIIMKDDCVHRETTPQKELATILTPLTMHPIGFEEAVSGLLKVRLKSQLRTNKGRTDNQQAECQ